MSEVGYVLYHILSIIPEDIVLLLAPFLVCTHLRLPLYLTCIIITLIWIAFHPARLIMIPVLGLRGLILYLLLALFGPLGMIASVLIHGIWNWYFLKVHRQGAINRS